jgi:hypothetical protein
VGLHSAGDLAGALPGYQVTINGVVLTLLMGQSNLDINRGAARSTPLHLACELDDPHSVRILLNHPRINLLYNNITIFSNVDKNNKRAIDLAGVKTR